VPPTPTTPRSTRALVAAAAWALTIWGCGGLGHVVRNPAHAARTFALDAVLNGRPIELHLAAPPAPGDRQVLVLYASGDGGWFGAAVDMFRAIGDAGFYAVGVSSRSLLHGEKASGRSPAVGDLADDYAALLDRASEALGLPPDRRVVLSGWSRGASLAVLVGGSHHAPRNLAGVIAIGLAADENLTVRQDTDDDPPDQDTAGAPILVPGGPSSAGALDLYARLADVAPRRCAVIQSTGDAYLPASRARALFGADTSSRRFFEVPASNHRFSGAGEQFVQQLGEALRWIAEEAQS
jgi:hypothetical protein